MTESERRKAPLVPRMADLYIYRLERRYIPGVPGGRYDGLVSKELLT